MQWDAASDAGVGQGALARYRERFQAWLAEARDARLTAVLSLTSYDGVRPGSAAAYVRGLQALLAQASAAGEPIAFLEPWNEPNNQGHASPTLAALFANAAAGRCARAGCVVLAGDVEDSTGAAAWLRSYRAALRFSPLAWAVHPYASVAGLDDLPLLRVVGALPAHSALWYSEISTFYCRHGVLRGEGAQAREAAYLASSLMREPGLEPVHAFYYDAMGGGGTVEGCAGGLADDGALYAGATARPAAALLLAAGAGQTRTAEFGPGPGAQSLEAL